MGRNNRDYKIKDKNLTKNKKNAKLNKSIAFTLASMATIGTGTMIGGQMQEANAMLGRLGSTATKVYKTVSFATPTTKSFQKVITSRSLTGPRGAINSGLTGKFDTQFQGMPKTSANGKTQNFKPKTSTSSTLTTPKREYGSNVKNLKGKFQTPSGKNNVFSPEQAKQNELVFSQKNGNGKTQIITTEGFFRR